MKKKIHDEIELSNKERLSRYFKVDPLQIILKELPENQKDKFYEYRRLWQKVDKDRLEIPFPLNIYIELVSDCNLKCTFCVRYRKRWKEKIPNIFSGKMLGIDNFKRIIDEGCEHGLPAIWVGASGEALLEKNFTEMMEYAQRKGIIDNILITNGTLLNKGTIDKLLNIPITRINISIDAFRAETYKKLRGGNYKKLHKMVNYLITQKEKLNIEMPVIRVTFVDTAENTLEKDEFISYWNSRKVVVDIQKLHNFDYNPDDYPENKDRKINCSFPWRTLMVLANGDVLPCCSFYSVGEHNLGNINDTSIEKIWTSQKLNDLRKSLTNGNYTNRCKLCFDSQN